MTAMSGSLVLLRSLHSQRNDSRQKHFVQRLPGDFVRFQQRSGAIGLR
jgi:hypothetical protein